MILLLFEFEVWVVWKQSFDELTAPPISSGGVTESNFYGGDGRGAPLRTRRQCAAQQQQVRS